jgi:DNA invertase Pin-like site-specific DNA recombinase
MMSSRRAAIYGRVSTDWQTTDNQTVALRELAERRDWEVVEVYIDHAISGAKGRDKRPSLDQMLKDASRRKFDVVMAWSIDRMGRSLRNLLETIEHLEDRIDRHPRRLSRGSSTVYEDARFWTESFKKSTNYRWSTI